MKANYSSFLTVARFLLLLGVMPFNVPAATPCTNTVQNTGDNGPGSLRAALAAATNGETITFCPAVTGTIALTSGELILNKRVTILGPGANVLAINGSAASRVFHINSNLVVTIAGLTLTNGLATVNGRGGAIYNDHSSVTVSNCTLSGNAANYGGGIANDGIIAGSASLKIHGTTLNGNTAVAGGGVFSDGQLGGATVEIVNSTFSGNSASFAGGGVFGLGLRTGIASVSVLNSTFNSNSNGGIVVDGQGTAAATLSVGSTILNAGGVSGTNAASVTSRGYNLSSDSGGGFLNQPTDLLNTDPGLGSLLLNDGPTPTHALRCGPAIDKGTNFIGLATDQRGDGFPRTFGAATDIGAFELQEQVVVDTTPPTIHCPANIVATNDAGQCSAVVNYTVSADDNCSSVTLSEDFPSGSTFSKGINSVTVTGADLAGNTSTCTFTITVLDKEAPQVQCRPAPNPSGKTSEPGKNGATGVNPSGYYELLAKDNCDANPKIYIMDTGSTFVAGPFKDGDIVRLKHAGGEPSSSPGTEQIVAVISLNGNGLAVADDADGNRTPDAGGCVMAVSLK
jgi:HYR domain-containing protein